MRREKARVGERPVRMAMFVRSFHIGGTEGQVVELLRGLPRSYDIKVAVTHDAGQLLEQVWKLGFIPDEFSFHGSVKKPNTFWQIARLAAWYRKHRVELVHAHDFYTALLAIPAAKLAGVRSIIGRLDLAHFHTPWQRKALIACTRMADHVVANADAIKRMVAEEEGIPEERVTVIHNGIELGRFDRRMSEELEAPLPETGDAPLLVHVANMAHPVKRQEDLLHALARLRQSGQKLHAFLIGDGPRRPMMEALARQLGLQGMAHFLQHRTDVPAILARSTLGVLCSSHEGLSNAVIEGMSARLPMVVTGVGGNPDLIVDRRSGFVVPPFQPEALAEAIGKVLSDPARARSMGQRGREFVEQHLSLERLCERHDEMYRKVVEGRGSRSRRSAAPRGRSLPPRTCQ